MKSEDSKTPRVLSAQRQPQQRGERLLLLPDASAGSGKQPVRGRALENARNQLPGVPAAPPRARPAARGAREADVADTGTPASPPRSCQSVPCPSDGEMAQRKGKAHLQLFDSSFPPLAFALTASTRWHENDFWDCLEKTNLLTDHFAQVISHICY